MSLDSTSQPRAYVTRTPLAPNAFVSPASGVMIEPAWRAPRGGEYAIEAEGSVGAVAPIPKDVRTPIIVGCIAHSVDKGDELQHTRRLSGGRGEGRDAQLVRRGDLGSHARGSRFKKQHTKKQKKDERQNAKEAEVGGGRGRSACLFFVLSGQGWTHQASWPHPM